MTEFWRIQLYCLGFVSAFAFGGRFLLQWLTSEIKGQSTVPRSFWILSLVGNVSLLIHSIIQVQFHVALIQSCNAVISWRNLNLLKPPSERISFSTTWVYLIASVTITTLLFLLQNPSDLFRVPVAPWQTEGAGSVPMSWHVMGTIGLVLFNSRFWVQWWSAERQGRSYLGPAFWWISLIGDALCLVYFIPIKDSVNLIGPIFGLIPYIRNLMLLRKQPVGEES